MSQASCKRCGAPMEASSAVQGMCTKCLMELGMEEDSHVVITGAGAAAPAPPPTPEELQPLFPNHHIEALIGQGGMGVVYKATQTGLDREVALKVLPAAAGRDPAFAERFQREAKALATLNHPNITSVFDFGKAGEHFYLAMELVDGVNLRQLMAAQKVAPKQALQLVEQVCDALQYAHDEGVVHRDIKPENILLDRKGRLKITDFGLAKLLGVEDQKQTGLTMTHQIMGTPHYMAPEQVEHPADVDHRADIYSLGVVFYELLTGELPLGRFSAPSGKVQVDVRLDEVVLRALEKEPALRYQTAGAVKTDVHDIGEPGSGAAAAGGGAPRTPISMGSARGEGGGGGGGRVWLWVLAGVAAIILLPVGILLGGALFLGAGWAGSYDMAASAELEEGRILRAQEMLDRLSGVAILDTEEDGWAFTLPFRQIFGVSENVHIALADDLRDVYAQYRGLLEEHTTYEITGDSSGRVTISAFAEERSSLDDGLWTSFRAHLDPQAFQLLEERDLLRSEFMDYGEEPVVIELSRNAGRFSCGVVKGTSATRWEAGTELPDKYAPYWDQMFRPLAPSAHPALASFLKEVDTLPKAGEAVGMRSIDVDGKMRRSSSSHPEVKVLADLTFTAADEVTATLMFERFVERLEQIPGATVDAGRSAVLEDGKSIRANEVKLLVPASNPDLPLPGTSQTKDFTYFLRSTAVDSGIGSIDINPSYRTMPGPGRDVEYKIQHVKGGGPPHPRRASELDRGDRVGR